jgi:hypothetical protein
VNRLYLALAAFAALALLSWKTISDQKMRLATLAVLALFAVKTLLHRRDAGRLKEVDSGESEHTPM